MRGPPRSTTGGLEPGPYGKEVKGGTVRGDPQGGCRRGESVGPGAVPPFRRASPDGAPGAGFAPAAAWKSDAAPIAIARALESTIDGWLAADEMVPKKQRHTARCIFQRLVDEYDAEVSESSVRRYVGINQEDVVAVSLPDVCVPRIHLLGG